MSIFKRHRIPAVAFAEAEVEAIPAAEPIVFTAPETLLERINRLDKDYHQRLEELGRMHLAMQRVYGEWMDAVRENGKRIA